MAGGLVILVSRGMTRVDSPGPSRSVPARSVAPKAGRRLIRVRRSLHRARGEPRGDARPGDGAGRRQERQSVASGNVEEPAAEERADRAAEPTARLDHAEDCAEMWTREDVSRNRRELGNPHTESDPRHRVE